MPRLLTSHLVCALAFTSVALSAPAPATAAPAVTSAAAALDATSTTTDPSTTVTVAGGGYGMSGPASSARIVSDTNLDAAPDGTLLVQDVRQVLRVDPVADRVQVLVPPNVLEAIWLPKAVVADGNNAPLLLHERGIDRIGPGGSLTSVSATEHITAIDVGADHIIWGLMNHRVYRLAPGGSWVEVPNSAVLVDPIAITVTPDGSRAFVLDRGEGHAGVYPVTPSGLGTRVAGNGTTSGSLAPGVDSRTITVAGASSLTTNGTTVTLSAMDVGAFTFPVAGGQVSRISTATCSYAATAMTGADTAVYCHDGTGYGAVHRFSSAGLDRGRLIGVDPDQPWSPDGVRADDSYLDTVRGAAGLPDGRVVFTTEHGLVREVTTTGILRTRARLAPLATGRGKVALGIDGTAYVTSAAGSVTRVTESGVATVLDVAAQAADVEVLADGSLAIADAAAHRVVLLAPGGTSSVLTSALGTPVDLARNGNDLLVADGGLRRVDTMTGAVTDVLSGGAPTHVTVTADGPWADPDYGQAPIQVVMPDGGLRPVKDLGGTVAQLQAVGDQSILRGGGQSVTRVFGPGLDPGPSAVHLTATPGEGRVTLTWDGTVAQDDLQLVAKRGSTAPRDLWDGSRVPVTGRNGQAVMLIDGHPLVPGEQWSFALFTSTYGAQQGSARAWSAPAPASAAALPDSTAPGQVQDVRLAATQLEITLGFNDPTDDDFDHVVVRYALGTTPPATPTDGLELPDAFPGSWSYGSVPSPVRGQDYAVSIFALDHQGNASVWSRVTRLDFDPPAPAADLQVVPDFQSASFAFTAPSDADYASYAYAVQPAGATPDLALARVGYGANGIAQGLVMDTDYILTVWTRDTVWNHSAPVTVPFRTRLDTVAPGSPANVTATGGDYAVTATWTSPGDADLKGYVARLTDAQTGLVTEVTLEAPTTTFTWGKLPGGRDYSVDVVSVDSNGLRSPSATALARTAADANGAPPALQLSDVTVTPASSTSVTISLPRPALPDLKSIQYDVRPLGSSPDPVGTLKALSLRLPTVTGTVTLPARGTAYTLVLYVEDFNGNRSRTVIPSVQGAPNASELPLAPVGVFVSTPQDNTIDANWGVDNRTVAVTSWQVTATSGTLSKTVTLDGSSRSVRVTGLAGRTTWTLTLRGVGALGLGARTVMSSIVVGDTTAPRAVTGATWTPAFDTDVVRWVNPTDFDLDRVEVTRLGQTAAETKLLYRGKGTSVTSTGLVAGRTYRYQIRSYDTFGQTLSTFVQLETTRAVVATTTPASVRYASAATVTGTLRWKGLVPSARGLTLYAQPVGRTTWTAVTSTTASTTGTYSFSVKPAVSTRYRVGYAGAGSVGGAYSPVRTVTVVPTLTMTVSRSSFALGGSVVLSTVVRPGHSGSSVQLQRWNAKSWATIVTTRLSSTSTAKATIRPTSRGTQSYRWVLPAHTDHGTGVSPKGSVKVT